MTASIEDILQDILDDFLDTQCQESHDELVDILTSDAHLFHSIAFDVPHGDGRLWINFISDKSSFLETKKEWISTGNELKANHILISHKSNKLNWKEHMATQTISRHHPILEKFVLSMKMKEL